jgi:hypothetical protein
VEVVAAAIQLAARLELAAVGLGSREPQTVVRQRLTRAVAAVGLEMMLIQVVFLAVQAVPAWLSFVAAEQRLPTQAPQQLQWLVVTTYIHSLATDQ